MSRPTKLTAERAARIMALVAEGCHKTVAARAGGISDSTYRAWMARGRDAERDDEGAAVNKAHEPYVTFHDSIQQAEALAEVAAVTRIRDAATAGSWKAAAWFLERKHCDRWGRRDQATQELSGPNGEPIAIDAKAQLLALLTARRPAELDPLPINSQDCLSPFHEFPAPRA
jgi:hypothetical protein